MTRKKNCLTSYAKIRIFNLIKTISMFVDENTALAALKIPILMKILKKMGYVLSVLAHVYVPDV